MIGLPVTRRVIDQMTWAASSDLAALDLPKEGWVTEIRVRIAATMSAGLTAVQPDGLRRVIQNFKIEGDGGYAFLGLAGEQLGRLWGLCNIYDGMGNLITLQDGAAESITFVFHPGSNPKDPFDTSVVIPASALSTFQAKWTTTANSVVDDTITISSAIGTIELDQIMNVKTHAALWVPMGSTRTLVHSADASDYSEEVDIPAGAWLRRIIMLVQDETATRPVRKDDEVTAVRIKDTKTNRIMLEETWEGLKARSARLCGLQGVPFQVADTITGHANIPDGFAIIDLRNYTGHPYGLNLIGKQTGDYKLGLTIANYTAGDDTIIYWDQVKQIDPVFVGK